MGSVYSGNSVFFSLSFIISSLLIWIQKTTSLRNLNIDGIFYGKEITFIFCVHFGGKKKEEKKRIILSYDKKDLEWINSTLICWTMFSVLRFPLMGKIIFIFFESGLKQFTPSVYFSIRKVILWVKVKICTSIFCLYFLFYITMRKSKWTNVVT